MDPLPPNAGWDLVKDALQRLREDNDRFEQFCLQQLDELDRRRAELEEREQQLAQEQGGSSEELAQARAQLARLASVAVELADTKEELSQLRSELEEQQKIAAKAMAQAAAYETQVGQLKQDMATLEAEIEEVRHSADDQKRRVAEERAEWVGELLRSALDIKSHLDDGKDADLKLVHHENEAGGEPASAGRIDPVLSAVMAQFESLQKGKERSGGGKSGKQGVA